MILSIVIPTYRRERILVETIQFLLPLCNELNQRSELLVIDQTEQHHPETQDLLTNWNLSGAIRWLRLPMPHLTGAMNAGLVQSKGDIVLYLDDDVIPDCNLLKQHLLAHSNRPEAWAVVGQILQPGQQPEPANQPSSSSTFWRDLNFRFNSIGEAWIENAMAGNMSLKRRKAIDVGGFDMNFLPPVASRFETEFAKRLVRSGGKICFFPAASIQHLAASSGGTRSRGSHLKSASPCYGIGDCYFALRCANGWDLIWYLARKPFREVRTKFHLMHPWWIPVKLLGEMRALLQACSLAQKPPALIADYSAHFTDGFLQAHIDQRR